MLDRSKLEDQIVDLSARLEQSMKDNNSLRARLKSSRKRNAELQLALSGSPQELLQFLGALYRYAAQLPELKGTPIAENLREALADLGL